MLKYLISCQNDGTIILENVTSTVEDKRLLQLTQAEFSLFMIFPSISKNEMVDKLWAISDKSGGKKALLKTVSIAYEILGRE